MKENTALDEQDEPLNLDPHVVVAAIRAVDAYVMTANGAHELGKLGRFAPSTPPVDRATKAFLDSLAASGFALTKVGA